MLKDYPDVLTVKDVADILRISSKSVYRLLNENIIGSVRIGTKYCIPKLCLINYLESAQYKVMQ